jgi:hypothetical protein
MTTIALLVWPFVSLVFFLTLRVQAAIAATIIGGYLLLPTQGGFNLPMLPTIDKSSVSALCALVFALVFAKPSGTVGQPGWLPRSPAIFGLMVLLLLGGFATVLTNGDAVFTGAAVIPGLRPYDALAEASTLLFMLIPFLLARKYLATPEDHRCLLWVLVLAGLGYSLLALYEVRMSPQLNRIVYGYFPHDWLQHLRGGGFRPLVFLNHGLWLGIFFACTTLAAFSLWRIERTNRRWALLLSGMWLLMTLVLSKTLGALLITLALLPVVFATPPRLQILAAAVAATVLTTYPVLRAGGLVPTDRVVAWSANIDPARAGSLQTRLDNEDRLLIKGAERPLFGWGGWGRSRVYDENGNDITITDGHWIILYTRGGWLRYVAEYGLLTYAIFALALRRRRDELDLATAGLAVVLAANLLDLIPNATQTSVTLLLAGALAGRLELVRQRTKEMVAHTDSAANGRPESGGVRPSGAGGGRLVPDGTLGIAYGSKPMPKGESPFTRFGAKPGRNA